MATAADLARWDIGLLSNKLLSAELTREETTAPMLPSGIRSPYALGLFVSEKGGRPTWSHVGQGLGFLASNAVYPGDQAAIVVLTNTSGSLSFAHIADRIAFLLLPPTPAEARARAIFASLQHGAVSRANLTPEFSQYLTAGHLNAYRTSLGRLGDLTSLVLKAEDRADGVTTRRYEATAGRRRLSILWEELADGRTDDFIVQPLLN